MKKIVQCLTVIYLIFSSSYITLAQKKVACIGNSITYGYGLSSQATESYPARLQVLLGNEYEIKNFGITSRTLLKNGDRPYWNETVYTQSLTYEPDIVIIMLGTNDAKLDLNWIPHGDEFSADYKALIKSYSDLQSAPKIFICKLVPAFRDIWDISDTIIFKEINPIIQQVAFEEGRNLIDMYNEMNNKNWFSDDGIHPNAVGALSMAEYLYNVMLHDTMTIRQDGNTLIASEGSRYQWYQDNIPIGVSDGGQAQTFEASESGEYKVAVTISSNRSTVLFSTPHFYEHETTSVENMKGNDSSVVIFPNPGKKYISFNLTNEKALALKLYTIDGKLVMSMNNIEPKEILIVNTEDLSDGIYFYQIHCVNKPDLSGKFIISK